MVQIEFRILSCFFNQDSCRFAEICRRVGYPSDLGGYYIRRLVQGGYVVKAERGVYTVTPKGKQQLVASYGEDLSVNRPRLCAMIIAKQDDTYIVLERDRQPYIGIVEWPAGMVVHGEPTLAAVQRLLHERLGVSAALTPAGMFRRTDMYKETVFDDKLFAIYTCTLPSEAQVHELSRTGRNVRRTAKELAELKNPSKSLLDILHFVSSQESGFTERVYSLRPEDLFA